MNDTISRQAALAIIEAGLRGRLTDDERLGLEGIGYSIVELPSVQPERKKGKWIGKPIAGCCTVRCPVCNDVFLENSGKWNFCPNCGAEMER